MAAKATTLLQQPSEGNHQLWGGVSSSSTSAATYVSTSCLSTSNYVGMVKATLFSTQLQVCRQKEFLIEFPSFYHSLLSLIIMVQMMLPVKYSL